MEGKDDAVANTLEQATEAVVSANTEDKIATAMEQTPGLAAAEGQEALPKHGARADTNPPAAEAADAAPVAGEPAAPAPATVPVPTTNVNKPRAPTSPLQVQQICLLALRGFTMLAAIISFAIGASIKGQFKKSLNFLIAAMVILFVGSGAFLAVLSLQILGAALKGPLEKVISGVAVLFDLILLLLAFGSSSAYATRIDLGLGWDGLASFKGKVAVSMGFLASLSQLATAVVGGYLFHLLSVPSTTDSDWDTEWNKPKSAENGEV